MLGMRLVSLQGAFGMEALSDAKSPGMLKLLIRHGADANSTNSNGETALMMAAFDGDYQKAAALIRAGADARMRNTKADTSAISYCTSGKIAGLLIANGADVNERNVYGTTPLIYAASRGCNDVAKVLLDNGADANANSPVAGTALMLAAYFNNAGLVDLLLSRGADVNAAGTDYFDGKKGKKTALRLAKENNLSDIVKILERHGARM
jgi:ankyrin repeat protein